MRIFYQASDVSRKTEKNAFLIGLRNLTEKRKQNLSMRYYLLIIFNDLQGQLAQSVRASC